MKIFITGATGLIGRAVAIGLRRAGHEVYGLVRSKDKGRELILNDVNIIVGDMADTATYTKIAAEAEVLIHCGADYANFAKTDSAVVQTFFEVAKTKVTPPRFIYTSGVLVYPDSKKVVNEDSPTVPHKGVPFLETRIGNELAILKNKDLFGVVVRPGFVVGPRMTHFNEFFEQAESKEKTVTVDGADIVWCRIHIDDLVDAYVRIAEAAPATVGGQVFNIADDARYSRWDIAQAYAAVVGEDVKVVRGKALKSMNKSVLTDHKKASQLLNWNPRHLPLLDEVELNYRRWRAENNK